MNKIIHILFHLRNLMIAFLLQFLYIVCGVDLSGDHFYKIGWPWLWYYRHIPYSPLHLPYAEIHWLNLAGVLLLGWLVLSLAESLLERMNMRYPRWRRYFSVLYLFMVGVPAMTALVCWGRYLFGFYVPRPVPTIYVLLVLFLLLLLAVFAVGEILWKLWDKIRYGDRALLWGGFALVASCVLWSGNYVLGKLMMSQAGVSAGEISFWRFVAAGLIMFAIACATRKKKVFALTRRDAIEVIGQGMLGMCMVGLLMFQSEKLTSAINASMLDALIPVRDSDRQFPDRPEADGRTVRRNGGQPVGLSAGDPGGHAGGDSVDPPRFCGPDDRRGGGLLGRVCAVGKRYAQTGGFTGLHHLGDDCRGGGHAGFQSAVPPAVETAA